MHTPVADQVVFGWPDFLNLMMPVCFTRQDDTKLDAKSNYKKNKLRVNKKRSCCNIRHEQSFLPCRVVSTTRYPQASGLNGWQSASFNLLPLGPGRHGPIHCFTVKGQHCDELLSAPLISPFIRMLISWFFPLYSKLYCTGTARSWYQVKFRYLQ